MWRLRCLHLLVRDGAMLRTDGELDRVLDVPAWRDRSGWCLIGRGLGRVRDRPEPTPEAAAPSTVSISYLLKPLMDDSPMDLGGAWLARVDLLEVLDGSIRVWLLFALLVGTGPGELP
jgi:hypothetical protein